jgi:PEP-CTERM motif
MELVVFVRSKTNCWVVGLAICLFLCLPTVANATFTSGGYVGSGYVSYSTDYSDGDGDHNFNTYLVPQGGFPVGGSGVYQSPSGDQVVYGLGARGQYDPHFVGLIIDSLAYSLQGSPTAGTQILSESLHLDAGGSFVATNNYFPSGLNEQIIGVWHVNLAGTVAPGLILGIDVYVANTLIGEELHHYTFYEGPYSVELNEVKIDTSASHIGQMSGIVALDIVLQRDTTANNYQSNAVTTVSGSLSGGTVQSSPYSPGDYDRDTDVDANDYAVWRQFFGESSGAATAADGNLDHVVDAADYVVWRKALSPGDFNLDGKVDAADYLVWRKNNGSAADYDLWRTHFGESISSGSGSSIESASVPEPSTLLLFGIGAISLLGFRKAKSHG